MGSTNGFARNAKSLGTSSENVSREARIIFVVDLDDICLLSCTLEDHGSHVRVVCELLRIEKIYARLYKCAFGC